jgi:hypothetical protein
MTNIFDFFTLYMVIFILWYPFLGQYLDMMFLGIITFVIGSYVSFINPKYYIFTFQDECYKIEGAKRILLVDMIHVIILVITIYMFAHMPFSVRKFVASSIILISYFVLVNPGNVYSITQKELWTLIYFTCFVYLLYRLSEKHV